MPHRRTVILGAAALVAARLDAARAASLAPPAGRVILTVRGKISTHNRDDVAVFDQAMLDAMPQLTIHTRTPWYDGVVAFDGVPMTALMGAVGAQGRMLTVRSLNDYVSEIPVSDFEEFHPILATRRDGVPMPVRDKGPLFVVYPYDSAPALMTQKYFSRSPWQVAEIDVG